MSHQPPDPEDLIRLAADLEQQAEKLRNAPFGQGYESVGPYCSFCGKKRLQVLALIAGPEVHICNECIGLCVSLLSEQGIKL